MSNHKKRERVLWPFALLVYSAFNIGGHIPHGNIIAYGSLLAFLLALLIVCGFCLRVKIPVYHLHILFFTIYCLASVLWADNKGLALEIGKDMLVILILSTITCLSFQDVETLDPLLKLLMWSGYIVAAYGTLFYGFGAIKQMLTAGTRVSNDAMNANTLGMMSAYAVLINFYYILKEKRIPLFTGMSILAIIVIAISESRKALAIVFGGVLMLIIFNSFADRNGVKRFFKLLGAGALFLIAFFIAMRLPIFYGIRSRVQSMLNAVTGAGAADYSTVARGRLTEIGFDIFRSHPILGVGMDNARIIAGPYFNRDEYYLHNNYVELLADGGLVGFTLYYSMFFYLGVNLFKKKNFKDKEFNLCLSLFLTRLLVDIGQVSYNGRLSYFLILILILKARMPRRKENKGVWKSHDSCDHYSRGLRQPNGEGYSQTVH